MSEILNIEQKLREHRINFDSWILKNYAVRPIDLKIVDGPSYHSWDEIAEDVTDLFNNFDLRNLSDEASRNLLFLIGRNWDMGWIIAWLSNNKKLSNLGDLDEDSFYHLCEQAMDCEDEDAQSQFPASFKKFESLNPKREKILLRFFSSPNTYTKRCSMDSLSKLSYGKLNDLVSEAWKVDDEWVKHTCLEILIENESNDLNEYMELAKGEDSEILNELIKGEIDDR